MWNLPGKYRVPTRVLSSLTDPDIPVDEEANSGTLITFEEDPKMEKVVVSGIAFSRNEAKITLPHVPDTPGIRPTRFLATLPKPTLKLT